MSRIRDPLARVTRDFQELGSEIRLALRVALEFVDVLVPPYTRDRVCVTPALLDFVNNPDPALTGIQRLGANARPTIGELLEPAALGRIRKANDAVRAAAGGC
jgi:hypothetical protein